MHFKADAVQDITE